MTTRDFRYFKSENLVLATAYGASPTIDDNGPAFQKALDAAAEMGGATVYAPAGLYRFQTNITVPSNVELRGCFSVLQRPAPHGLRRHRPHAAAGQRR